jgi:hypothetical protein
VNGLGYYIEAWCAFLRGAEAVIGLPLCAAGAIMILTGWRIWPVVAFAALALAGGVAGQLLSRDATFQPAWGGVGAAVLLVVGALLYKHTPTLVGGIAGGAVISAVMAQIGLEGPVLAVGAVLGFLLSGAWAFAYKHQVVVGVSSLAGGVLLASGVSVMLPEIPLLYGFFRSMTARTPLMMLFFVVVPTAVGVTLQYADSNRSSSKAVRS